MTTDAQDRNMIWANRFSFTAAGFSIASWAPMIPYVKERFALDEHTLGLLLLCVGIGSFVAMPMAGYFTSKFGCKKPVYVAALASAATLGSVPFIYNIYTLAVVLFIMGIAAITLDVVSNINAALVEEVTERNIMSGLHGLYSVGGLLGSLTVTFLLSLSFDLTIVGTYAAFFILIIVLTGCKHLIPDVHIGHSATSATTDASDATASSAAVSTAQAVSDNATVLSEGTTASNGTDIASSAASRSQSTTEASMDAAAKDSSCTLKYYTHPTVLFIGLMCLILFMTEGSMLDWSGVFLHSERGLAIEYAGYGYAAFAVMMTICRLLGDSLVNLFGRGKVIVFGTLCVIAGFIIAVAIPHYAAAFVGFALIGIGSSNVIPQLVSITARIKEVPTHISVTIVNALGFSGMLIGPALIGFLAHAITLPYTYLCHAASVFFVTVMSVILIKRSKHTRKGAH